MKLNFVLISALGFASAVPTSKVGAPESTELVTRTFAQGDLFNSTVAIGPFISLLKAVEDKVTNTIKKVITKTIARPPKFQGWKTYKVCYDILY
jgi:hypothetical protein